MCLLGLVFRQIPGTPVFVAANREESYARPTTEPALTDSHPPVLCGQDLQAGGTWLGVNANGLLIAVTNRPKTAEPREPRSRGLLCRDLLNRPNARLASQRAAADLQSGRYRGCNVVCADPLGAYVVHGGDWLRLRPVPPGIHVLTTGDLNDFTDPRVLRAYNTLQPLAAAPLREWLETARLLCRDHGTPPICQHDQNRGTVSSTLVALGEEPAGIIYWHSPGPPCQTPYTDYSGLARQCVEAGRARVHHLG